jgi:hypothetical protein
MRSRNIKPGYFQNDQLAECEPLARILFAGLWCFADKKGRFEWRPRKMKIQILPYDNRDINELLDQLISAELVKQYNIDGKDYGLVRGFLTHQNPHHREAESTIPGPKTIENYEPGASTDLGTAEPGESPADSLIPDSLIHKDRKGPEKRKIRKAPPVHFSMPSGPELEKRLKAAGQKIEAETERKGFKPFQWCQKMFNSKYHPLAITEILEYMATSWTTIEKPFAFGESSLKIRSGNYYEKDNKVKADVDKGVFNELVDKLRRIK